eukprot:3885215-Rhodomonas_salina.1
MLPARTLSMPSSRASQLSCTSSTLMSFAGCICSRCPLSACPSAVSSSSSRARATLHRRSGDSTMIFSL